MDVSRGEGLREYGGIAGQDRVLRRRGALLDAVLDTLGAPSPAPATVRGVCRMAGLTPRYFYESFPSIDAAVGAAFDEVIAEISTRAEAAFADGDGLSAQTAAAVRVIVDIIDSDRRKGRLLFSPALTGPIVAEKRAQSTDLFAGLTVRSGRHDVEQATSAAAARALAVAHFQVGGFARLLASWLAGDLPLGRDELVEISVRLLLSPTAASLSSDATAVTRG